MAWCYPPPRLASSRVFRFIHDVQLVRLFSLSWLPPHAKRRPLLDERLRHAEIGVAQICSGQLLVELSQAARKISSGASAGRLQFRDLQPGASPAGSDGSWR